MLELDHVTHVCANGTRALDDVSLSIPKGMFGLLRPNGAGKSTLMRTVATLQAPSRGTITFNGIDILATPDRLRERLGYLPQDFGVYPRVSAYRPVRSGEQSIRVVTRRKPAFAGIDPYNKYIDRNSDDNVVAVTG